MTTMQTLSTILVEQTNALGADWVPALLFAAVISIFAFFILVIKIMFEETTSGTTIGIGVFFGIFVFSAIMLYQEETHNKQVIADFKPKISAFCEEYLSEISRGNVKWIHPDNLKLISYHCGTNEVQDAANSPSSQMALYR